MNSRYPVCLPLLVLFAACSAPDPTAPAAPPTTGSLAITVIGSPHLGGSISISRPPHYYVVIAATTTLEHLAPGTYTIAARNIDTGDGILAPAPVTQSVDVAVSATATTATVTYSPQVTAWTTLAPAPTRRAASACGVIDGILYVVGGSDGHELNTLEAFDPSTSSWSTKAPMPTPRKLLGVGVVNGILYAVGGADEHFTTFFPTVEAYDPATDT